MASDSVNRPRHSMVKPSRVSTFLASSLKHCHIKRTHLAKQIYVIRGLKTNLLGLPVITSLQLVCRINEMTCDNHSIQARFPELFKGFGSLWWENHTKSSSKKELAHINSVHQETWPFHLEKESKLNSIKWKQMALSPVFQSRHPGVPEW